MRRAHGWNQSNTGRASTGSVCRPAIVRRGPSSTTSCCRRSSRRRTTPGIRGVFVGVAMQAPPKLHNFTPMARVPLGCPRRHVRDYPGAPRSARYKHTSCGGVVTTATGVAMRAVTASRRRAGKGVSAVFATLRGGRRRETNRAGFGPLRTHAIRPGSRRSPFSDEPSRDPSIPISSVWVWAS